MRVNSARDNGYGGWRIGYLIAIMISLPYSYISLFKIHFHALYKVVSKIYYIIL